NSSQGNLLIDSGNSKIGIQSPFNATAGGILRFSALNHNHRATITFFKNDAGVLGGSGPADPQIKFSNPPTVVNGTIVDSEGTGWAVYNGTDFASYDPAHGIISAPNFETTDGNVLVANSDGSKNWLITNENWSFNGTLNFNTVKIAPVGQSQSLSHGSGTSTLNTDGILLTGANDFRIDLTNITGSGPRYLWVTNPS